MPDNNLTENQIRTLLSSMHTDQKHCGFDAFVVMKETPKLKSMSLSEKTNNDTSVVASPNTQRK